MKASAIVLSGIIASALGVPLDGHVVHEKRNTASPSWVKREPLDGETKLPVRIALKQRNLERGMEYLIDVSDPRSVNYGRHLSQDQVVERFAPSDESIAKVKRWLVEAGISERSIVVPKSKGWVQFDARASQVESVLHTKYHVYDHIEARGEHIGTDEYHLPRDVASVVDFITPGVAFATRRVESNEKRMAGIKPKTNPMPAELMEQLTANPDALTTCSQAATPACIKAMYNISDPTLSDPSNAMGIYEDGDVYLQSDLNKFFAMFATNIPQGTAPKLNSVNGATLSGTPEGEADLDFQIAYPIIYPQKLQDFQVNTGNFADLFNTFLDAVDGSYCTFSDFGETGDDPTVDGKHPNEQCGAFKPTNVISFSYGTAEVDYPVNYQKRQCDEFMKLGLQGTTLVLASGDDGVARRSGPCLGPNQNIFTPDYPANCPYVTAVGSTALPKGGKPGDAEMSTKDFSSGGGFSNVYPTPDYQSDMVGAYFANHKPTYKSYSTSNGTIPTTGGIYNSAGRGYPDMSALGDVGAVFLNGQSTTIGGTSMAAPLAAAIFTRINDERIAAGKGPIGFVNPTLYAHPEMFHDVTVGNQDKGGPNGDGAPSACGNKGFSAVEGWDPVSGMGTPDYPSFLQVFMSQ